MDIELDLQYKNIGKVIRAFNFLDNQLNSFIGWIISDDIGVGQIITSQIKSLSARTHLFFALYKNQSSSLKWFNPPFQEKDFDLRDKLVEEANNLRNQVLEISEIRNKIVHSVWFQQQRHIDEFGDNAQLTSLDIRIDKSKNIDGGKVGLKYDVVTYSSDELIAFRNKINNCNTDLDHFRKKTEGIDQLR